MAVCYLINAGNGNACATVDGFPWPGIGVVSRPFSGAEAQRWVAEEFSGGEPASDGSKVYALCLERTGLAITAGDCRTPVTLQRFQRSSLSQLWTYTGTDHSLLRNLGTGCVLDLDDGTVDGGVIQTWEAAGSSNQIWTLAWAIGQQEPADVEEEGVPLLA
jgi:hypothetical protein